MEETLRALGQILVEALPTFFIVLFLHFYLKAMFFGPLQRILEQRRQATEGARQAATASLQAAEAKVAQYELQIRSVRNDVYREQEELRRRWADEQAVRLKGARESADDLVKRAKADLQTQVIEAKRDLAGSSQAIADQITETILHGRAA